MTLQLEKRINPDEVRQDFMRATDEHKIVEAVSKVQTNGRSIESLLKSGTGIRGTQGSYPQYAMTI